MSVKGPSLANSQLHNFDDSREASDVPRKRPSPSSNTNQSKIVPSQAKENTKVENVIASDFIANFKGPPTPLEICLPVIAGEEKYPDQDDLVACDSSVVAKRTYHIVQRWGRVVSIPPQQFLSTILQKRGYNDQILSALSPEIRRPPTAKQLKDYDNEIVWAVRNSDLKKLEELHSTGKSLTACNCFSESIVHMACRRSEKEIVQFLIQNGSDLSIIDDFGRTPLHDACWRPEPRFDIVTMILDVNCGLLQLADLRGSTPLNYVREEHWVLWCAYLFNQLEKYWPMNNGSPSDSEHVAKRQRIEG